ncbi:hypothetical protein ACOMHN_024197 [Nucella lapillus]
MRRTGLLDVLQNENSTSGFFSPESTHQAKVHTILEAIPVVTDGLDGGWFGKIGTSAILLFGTLGNVMTITILRHLRAGWSAMNVYLTALAVSDTVMLYSGALPMWTRKVMHFDLYANQVVVCKVLIWMMNSSAALSAWLLVALTAQRAASVVWPHRVNILCTRRKSVIISIVIAITCALLYSHTLLGYELVQFENGTSVKCTFGFPSYQHFWVNVWVRVDMFVYSLLPCFCLILSNGVLGWKLAASMKEVSQAVSSTKEEQKSNRQKRVSSATVTVIIVSMAFVLITLPLMTYNTFFHGYASKDEQSRQFHYFLYDFFFVFGLSNFAWNFYLYCLTGTKFRREFLKIVCGCCGCKPSISGSNRSTEHVSGLGTTQKNKASGVESNDDF